MTRRLGIIAAACTLAFAASSCATDTETTELEGGAQVIKEGKLTVCTHLPYEPFQYKEGGKIVGFDVDLMDLVAEELGVEQEIVNTPFETIETGQAMATGKAYAEDNAPDDVELKTFEDLALLTSAVKTGDVAAAVNDNGVLYDYAAQNPDTEVTAEFDTGEQYGFGVAKDKNDALIETVNKVLAEAAKDGRYEEIFRKYFPDAQLPDFVS